MGLLLLARRNLLRRRLRTTLSAAGIATGVALVLVLSSLVAGTADQVRTAVRALGGADLTVYNGTTATREEFLLRPTGSLDGSWSTRIRQDPRVTTVASELYFQGRVGDLDVPMVGVDRNYTQVVGPFNVVQGRALDPGARDQILLGRPVAAALNLSPGSVTTIRSPEDLEGSVVTVVGVYETGIDFLDRGAYVDLGAAQALTRQPGRVTAFLLKLGDPSDASATEEGLAATLPGTRMVSLSSVLTRTTDLLSSLTLFFTLVGVVSLAAGTFGVVNTMAMAVAERHREVGTLKALGATDGDVLQSIALEALLQGALGSGVGIALGVVADLTLPALGRRVLHLSQATLLNPVVNADSILLALGLGLAAGLVAGLYPAWRAARLPPSEALRHA